ncbi:MAG TPA: class I SAM-dependent methyltransferase [Acidimicrobiales bacterium]|nr:class I SAM-dependent methyltransferase [Acidimicrobiales bacterium]
MTTTTASTTPDYTAIKTRQQGTWSSGDYAVIGTTLQIVGENLCEAVDIAAGEDVLDVAAGNGNASLAAARRGGKVVATDYVPALLEGTSARASAEGMQIATREADAEALPFGDASFDVVLSTFGVMFTPNQDQAASELLRVCRPNGRIGLANWTPESFVGQMFKIVGRYVASPAGVRSPLEWGNEARLRELLSASGRLDIRRRHFVFRYESAEDWLDTFREFYGPTLKAFGALDAAAQSAMEVDLLILAREHNTSTSRGWRVPSEYVEVVATV